jgi:hypothetical protein
MVDKVVNSRRVVMRQEVRPCLDRHQAMHVVVSQQLLAFATKDSVDHHGFGVRESARSCLFSRGNHAAAHDAVDDIRGFVRAVLSIKRDIEQRVVAQHVIGRAPQVIRSGAHIVDTIRAEIVHRASAVSAAVRVRGTIRVIRVRKPEGMPQRVQHGRLEVVCIQVAQPIDVAVLRLWLVPDSTAPETAPVPGLPNAALRRKTSSGVPHFPSFPGPTLTWTPALPSAYPNSIV